MTFTLDDLIKYSLVFIVGIGTIVIGFYKVIKPMLEDKPKSTKDEGDTDEDTRPHRRRTDVEGNFYHKRVDNLGERMDEIIGKQSLEDIRMERLEANLNALAKENAHLFKQNGTLFEKFDMVNSKIDGISSELGKKMDEIMRLMIRNGGN